MEERKATEGIGKKNKECNRGERKQEASIREGRDEEEEGESKWKQKMV